MRVKERPLKFESNAHFFEAERATKLAYLSYKKFGTMDFIQTVESHMKEIQSEVRFEYNDDKNGFMFTSDMQGRKWFVIKGSDNRQDLLDDVHLYVNKNITSESIISLFRTFEKEVIPFLGESKIILTGHSLGGAKAQLLMLAYPEYIDKVYLYNSPSVREYLDFSNLKPMPRDIQSRLDKAFGNSFMHASPNDIKIYDFVNLRGSEFIVNALGSRRFENSIPFYFYPVSEENSYNQHQMLIFVKEFNRIVDYVKNSTLKEHDCKPKIEELNHGKVCLEQSLDSQKKLLEAREKLSDIFLKYEQQKREKNIIEASRIGPNNPPKTSDISKNFGLDML